MESYLIINNVIKPVESTCYFACQDLTISQHQKGPVRKPSPLLTFNSFLTRATTADPFLLLITGSQAVGTGRALWTYVAQCRHNEWMWETRDGKCLVQSQLSTEVVIHPYFRRSQNNFREASFFNISDNWFCFQVFVLIRNLFFMGDRILHISPFSPGKYCHHGNYFLILHCLVKIHVAKW